MKNAIKSLTEREDEIVVLQSSQKKFTNQNVTKTNCKCNLCGKHFTGEKHDHGSKCAALTKLRNLPISISFSK